MRDVAAMDVGAHKSATSVCIVGRMGHLATLAPLATQGVLITAMTLPLRIVLMVKEF